MYCANVILLAHESRCTRGDNIPRIALRTEPIVNIEVEVPRLHIDNPEETLELRKDSLGGEHFEPEHETDRMGPVHRDVDGRSWRSWRSWRGVKRRIEWDRVQSGFVSVVCKAGTTRVAFGNLAANTQRGGQRGGRQTTQRAPSGKSLDCRARAPNARNKGPHSQIHGFNDAPASVL
jgi:hypothetical protein